VPDGLALPEEVEALLFRAAQEAFRNVRAHAGARTVRASVSNGDGRVVLEVEDDGAGFTDQQASNARADGHLGLPLLRDLAQEAGATIDVRSTPGRGTTVRLEVPLP
jgi:two-component system nitrate/nitrite sensor histidine kinase NarX